MRRMKDMAALQPGMNFYGELPDSYNFIVNTEHPLIVRLRDKSESAVGEKIVPLENTVTEKNNEISTLRSNAKDGKLDDEQEKKSAELESEVNKAREEQEKIIGEYASEEPLAGQLVDIALLSAGLLKGENLSRFIDRSISLL